MPGQKRSKALRRARLADQPDRRTVLAATLRGRLHLVRAEREERLGRIRAKYVKKLDKLYAEWADERREVYRASDDKVNTIIRADARAKAKSEPRPA